jgi:hypothetical protein
MRDRTVKRARALGALQAGVVVAFGAAVAFACSSSSSNDSGGSGNDAGELDSSCGPLPESLSVSGLNDCVATVPNPCCTGFYGYACSAVDGGGPQCSETAACVRAARYDQSECAGAEAYSCPLLAGVNFATLPTPECEQMEGAGPVGEGIRWCCGPNLPPTTYDAAAPPQNEDASTVPPGNDAGSKQDAGTGVDSSTGGVDSSTGTDAAPEVDASDAASD